MKRKSILCVTLAAALAAGSLAGCGAPFWKMNFISSKPPMGRCWK